MCQLKSIWLGPVALFLLMTSIATQVFAQDEPLLRFGEINPQSSWGSILGFSSDGKHLFMRGDDHTVRLWNLESLQCEMQLVSAYDNDRSTCLSPDGHFLVTPLVSDIQSRKLGLYDLRDGKLQWEKEVDLGAHVSFSPDSQLLTLLDDEHRGFIQLREVESNARIGLLHHDLRLQFTPQLSFSPSGRFLAVPGHENDLVVFDLFQGGQPKSVTLPGRNVRMGSVDFIDEQSLVISSLQFSEGKSTSFLQLWDVTSGTMTHELEQFAMSTGREGTFVLSADRSRCVTKHSDHLAIWDLTSRTKLRELSSSGDGNGQGELTNFAISPDNSIVAANQGNGLLMWDATTGASLLPAEHKHKGDVICLAVSPDDSVLVSGGRDGAVYAWDAHTGVQLRKLLQTNIGVSYVAFLQEGSEVVIAGEISGRDGKHGIFGFVEIVRLADASRVKRWDLAGRGYGAVDSNGSGDSLSDEQWSAMGLIPKVRPRNQATIITEIGQRYITNENQSYYPLETTFDVPSENLFVSSLLSSRIGGDPSFVSCWSTRDSSMVWDKRFDDSGSTPRKLELSPDRRLLAIGLNGAAMIESPRVLLVDANSGRELLSCGNSKVHGTCLCFSNDGQRIFVGSDAGDITMWDVSSAYQGLGE